MSEETRNSTISEEMMANSIGIEIERSTSVASVASGESEDFIDSENQSSVELEKINEEIQTKSNSEDVIDGQRKSVNDYNNFAVNKKNAEGLMDIALLSANANQLRFLLQYNQRAPSYYISLGLVITSLCLQVLVGIMLIFKRSIRKWKYPKRFVRVRLNEILIGNVFLVTVVNVLLTAFTTTTEVTKI